MTSLTVWYGELTTRRTLLARGLLLIAGGTLWLLAFLLLPALVLVAVAFFERNADGVIQWNPTLESFRRLIGLGAYGLASDNLWIVLRSLALAAVTTVLSILLAYPMAFFIARGSRQRRLFWLSVVIVPLCTNLVVRIYAWKLLLSARLPPARLAAYLGLLDPGRDVFPSWLAVAIGMVSISLPFAIVPIYSNLDRLDWSVVEAAKDLYASPLRVFAQAILPQTLPGLGVATLLTSVPAMGMFVVTDMLGGAKHWLIGNLIQHQFGAGRNIPYGAALSLVLITLTLTVLLIFRRRNKVTTFL